MVVSDVTKLYSDRSYINKFHMQVRTVPVILTIIQLVFSLVCLLYNLTNSRTICFFYHFSMPSSTYLAMKYDTSQYQIFAVQFVAHLLVISAYVLAGIVFIYAWKRSKEGNQITQVCKWRQWMYVLLSLAIVGQVVVTGYSLSIIIQIGYENGTKAGDYMVATFQCVTLTSLLITFGTHLYNVQTMQEISNFLRKTDIKQEQNVLHAETNGFPTVLNSFAMGVLEKEKSDGIRPEMKLFKPNLNENTSPMGQHFQNLSQLMSSNNPSSARQPLLHGPQEQQNPQDLSSLNVSSSSSGRSVRKRAHIPKLKPDQVKKSQDSSADPIFLLNSLQISAIQPRNYQPTSKLEQEASKLSDYDAYGGLQTPRKYHPQQSKVR